MPSRLEAEALHTAAGTFPRAIEVKAIEDCTVEGRKQRKSIPLAITGLSQPWDTALRPRPTAGNKTKVVPRARAWIRQALSPPRIASRDSLAPCRKNSSAMAASVMIPMIRAPSPWQGSTLASTTLARSARMKGSIFALMENVLAAIFGSCKWDVSVGGPEPFC